MDLLTNGNYDALTVLMAGTMVLTVASPFS